MMFQRNKGSRVTWAKESGARDGKAEIPSENWGKGSVPFFIEALSEYQKRAKNLVLSSRDNLNAKVDGILSRAKEIDFLQTNLQIQESQIKKRETQIKDLQDLLNGYKEEQPIGRFARVQAIPSIVHFPVLLILGIGEYYVTSEAIIKLLGGQRNEATLVAIAVALLTIVGAHLLGTMLKLRLDRQRPQENWVKNISVLLGIGLITVIAFLAVLRAGQTAGGASTALENILGREEFVRSTYLVSLFFTLQLAFLIVGTVMAFLHYSPLAHQLHSAKRALLWDKAKLKRIQKRLAKLGSDLYLNREIVNAEIESIKAKIQLLGAEYVAICSSYKTANIHSRRDELNASHASMEEPVFVFEVNQFEDILQLAEKNFTRERS
jgi:hypothetical protein